MGVLSVKTVQTGAAVAKLGIQIDISILKTSGDAAIHSFHFQYLLCTEKGLLTRRLSLRMALAGKKSQMTSKTRTITQQKFDVSAHYSTKI